MVSGLLNLFGFVYLIAAIFLAIHYSAERAFSDFEQIVGFSIAAGSLLTALLLFGFSEVISDVKAIRRQLVPAGSIDTAMSIGQSEPTIKLGSVPAIYKFKQNDGATAWSFDGEIYYSEEEALDAREKEIASRVNSGVRES